MIPGGRISPSYLARESCDALKLSAGLLFSSFGCKNLQVSNCDRDYGLGFAAKIMFGLAREALGVFAGEGTLLHLLETLLCSEILLWAALSAVSGWDGAGAGNGISWISSLSESWQGMPRAATHTWALKSPILIFFPKNLAVNKSTEANNEQLWVQRSHRWS